MRGTACNTCTSFCVQKNCATFARHPLVVDIRNCVRLAGVPGRPWNSALRGYWQQEGHVLLLLLATVRVTSQRACHVALCAREFSAADYLIITCYFNQKQKKNSANCQIHNVCTCSPGRQVFKAPKAPPTHSRQCDVDRQINTNMSDCSTPRVNNLQLL